MFAGICKYEKMANYINIPTTRLTYSILEGYAYGKIVDSKINKWNGMVGALQSKSADLTVSELSITKERSEVVTYTQPIRVIR